MFLTVAVTESEPARKGDKQGRQPCSIPTAVVIMVEPVNASYSAWRNRERPGPRGRLGPTFLTVAFAEVAKNALVRLSHGQRTCKTGHQLA